MPARIAGLIEDLYAGVLDPLAWQRGLKALAHEWRAPSVVLARYHADSGERLGLDAEPEQRGEVAAARMPARDCVADAPTAAAGRRGYCLKRDGDQIVVLWLPEADTAKLRLESLMPSSLLVVHLLRAMELRAKVASASQHSAALATSVSRMNVALLSTDAHGTVLARSALAQKLLDARCGVHVDAEGTLRVTHTDASVVGIRRHGPRRTGDWVLRLPREGHMPLSVLLWPQRGPVKWMVMLCDPEVPLRVDLRLVAAELGLSMRESQVAIELCSGRTQGEIATHMEISINTVRTHVKSIYGKVGAHSQVALIRRIALSPAALLRAD